jgi:hypothetical protein
MIQIHNLPISVAILDGGDTVFDPQEIPIQNVFSRLFVPVINGFIYVDFHSFKPS